MRTLIVVGLIMALACNVIMVTPFYRQLILWNLGFIPELLLISGTAIALLAMLGEKIRRGGKGSRGSKLKKQLKNFFSKLIHGVFVVVGVIITCGIVGFAAKGLTDQVNNANMHLFIFFWLVGMCLSILWFASFEKKIWEPQPVQPMLIKN